jgi:hypothetical protein
MACPSGCTNGGGQIKSQPLVSVNALYAQSLQRGGGGSGGGGGARRERRERGQESEVQAGGVGVEEEVRSLRQVLHTLQHSGVGPSGHDADGQGSAGGESKGEGGVDKGEGEHAAGPLLGGGGGHALGGGGG